MKHPVKILLGLVMAWLPGSLLSAGESDDWAKALLAARAACWPDGKPTARIARSQVLKPMQEAERIELDVTGCENLWLNAQGIPDYHYARTAWCEPELIKADGTVVRLTTIKPTQAKVGWGQMLIDKDLNNAPLKIRNRQFAFGYWVHADSTLVFKLDRQYTKFRAWVGVTGGATPGSSRFVASDTSIATILGGSVVVELDRRFPRMQRLSHRFIDAWANGKPDLAETQALVSAYAAQMKKAWPGFQQRIGTLKAAAAPEHKWLALAWEISAVEDERDRLTRGLSLLDPPALRRAIDDLGATFPDQYPIKGFLERLGALNPDLTALRQGVADLDPVAMESVRAWLALQREALLANPLIDFDRLLLVRRSDKSPRLGLPQNWQSNCVLPRSGYGNDIAVLSPVSPDGTLTTLYRPPDDGFVGDLELHPEAGRILFSKSTPKKPWQVFEMKIDGSGPRRLTPDMGEDVDNYDACYLPNGDVLFTSSATMVAVPCVNGSTAVANIYRMSGDGRTVRQLCFDQEHNWNPRVMNNGRILYSRWEYADIPHSNSRRLFHMNPDGTGQMAYYGSNSYWPNGVFYARPIPGHPSQVVGIVTGHHGVPRMGELVIFDPHKGQSEADGVVQRIPGFGKKVEPIIRDQLVDDSWPKFLHPYPLGRSDGRGSGKFFLVSCKPSPDAAWGLYLVDIFDNMLLLKEEPGHVLFEPVPLKPRPVAPVIPDRVDLSRNDATVFLSDIYNGPGLKGIPRGEVKSLRVFTYVYGYRGMGGLYGTIGMDGPWDIRRVMGTVPVEADGSAFFRVPANTPISVQPLDKEGKALQVMRSWFTAMPGEVVSCVGCHESQDSAPQVRATMAAAKPPTDFTSWYGKTRGFAFAREVQPVLDAKCVRCHNGATMDQGRPVFSLRGDQPLVGWHSRMAGCQSSNFGGKFTVGYANLHRYVRHPGIESDIRLLVPMDYHADTTELVQTLRKGHYGVLLTSEEWDRLITWIDLNTPFHGDWATIAGDQAVVREKRRAELRRVYAHLEDYQIDDPPQRCAAPSVVEESVRRATQKAEPELPQGPVASGRPSKTIDLGDGIAMTFVYIPPGQFIMGSSSGHPDEQPSTKQTMARGFWMAATATTNEQFHRFDPAHNSRRESKQGYQFGVEGYPLFKPKQPVVRVSWQQAMAFGQWLSGKTGLKASLPTEAQWEYACRAGTTTPFWYGGLDTDFSKFANLADVTLSELAGNPYTETQPIPAPTEFDDWVPKETRFNDGALVSVEVGRYQPNPWGLFDMHGNVAQWTRSAYRPYPYVDNDGRNALAGDDLRVVRGGSWRDRPVRATASYRVAYRPYQPVFNVGFRLVLEE